MSLTNGITIFGGGAYSWIHLALGFALMRERDLLLPGSLLFLGYEYFKHGQSDPMRAAEAVAEFGIGMATAEMMR